MSKFMETIAETQKQRASNTLHAAVNELENARRDICGKYGISYTHFYNVTGRNASPEAAAASRQSILDEFERRLAVEFMGKLK